MQTPNNIHIQTYQTILMEFLLKGSDETPPIKLRNFIFLRQYYESLALKITYIKLEALT